MSKRKTLEKRMKELKILITLSETIKEADEAVQEIFPEYNGTTEEDFEKKYDLVMKIFGIGQSPNIYDDTFKYRYHRLLSQLILQQTLEALLD